MYIRVSSQQVHYKKYVEMNPYYYVFMLYYKSFDYTKKLYSFHFSTTNIRNTQFFKCDANTAFIFVSEKIDRKSIGQTKSDVFPTSQRRVQLPRVTSEWNRTWNFITCRCNLHTWNSAASLLNCLHPTLTNLNFSGLSCRQWFPWPFTLCHRNRNLQTFNKNIFSNYLFGWLPSVSHLSPT